MKKAFLGIAVATILIPMAYPQKPPTKPEVQKTDKIPQNLVIEYWKALFEDAQQNFTCKAKPVDKNQKTSKK